MDNRGNGIDYIVEKSSIPEEFKDIAEAQSKNTCDILNNRKTIKIVGPCSKWVEGEGWVTEIPVKLISEKVEGMVKDSSAKDFNDALWLLMIAYIFSNNHNGHCKIEKGNGDFNECHRICEYFKEDK